MLRVPECDRCQFYAHDPHIVCALHPADPGGSTCLDFRSDLDLEAFHRKEMRSLKPRKS
ncbi:MAG: hypothetical protein DSM106950_44385 [Stigonema ocellatum SAG 48.90 = DSM 106950]|nr:hypothetical protein [Stigonema ocellatum SAG 48.90 = DSM 106950]